MAARLFVLLAVATLLALGMPAQADGPSDCAGYTEGPFTEYFWTKYCISHCNVYGSTWAAGERIHSEPRGCEDVK